MSGSNFGIVGLGTMGRNLALNIESRGNRVAVWNLETDWITEFISKHPGAKFEGTPTGRCGMLYATYRKKGPLRDSRMKRRASCV